MYTFENKINSQLLFEKALNISNHQIDVKKYNNNNNKKSM